MSLTVKSFYDPFRTPASSRGHYLLVALGSMGLFFIFLTAWSQLQPFDPAWSSNRQLAALLIPFAIFLSGFLWCATKVHQNTLTDYFTGQINFAFGRTMAVFLLVLVLNATLDLILQFAFPGHYSYRPPDRDFIGLLAISGTLLVIQSIAEEVIFRGYVIRMIQAWTGRNLGIGLIGSSLIFMAMHGDNPENQAYGTGWMALSYFTAAIALALFSMLANGLEIAIGIHAANNVYGAVLTNYESSALETESLFILNQPSGLLFFASQSILFIGLYWILIKVNWITPLSAFKYLLDHDPNPA